MKDIFNLYINDKLVDFENAPKFEFKYQMEDFQNPTIVKNLFSKTITIEGTRNNNKIFGDIYNLDRKQLYEIGKYDGAYFDTSKRTDFKLFRNDELIESGYMELNSINVKNNHITYNINLYGGLGDFFYSLMFNDDGEKRTLADLQYKITDDEGNLLPKDSELDFIINKDFVQESWDKLSSGSTANTASDFITFAPCYNGLYDEFANDKIMVNTYQSQLFPNNENVTDNGVDYHPYLNYAMASVDREFNEWEVKDLRSYMQRPCIKVSKLLEAICDKDNNGGYVVKFDDTFFNKRNPYYNKTYMALPLLPTIIESTTDTQKEFKLSVDRSYYGNSLHVGSYNGINRFIASYRLGFEGEELSATASNQFQIDLSEVPVTSTFDVELEFDLEFVAEQLDNTQNNEYLYLSFTNSVSYFKRTLHYRSITVQAVMYDTELFEGERYYSNVLNFTSPLPISPIQQQASLPHRWVNDNDINKDNYTYTNVFGKFKREGTTNIYKWVADDTKASKFYINVGNVPRKKTMAIDFIVKYMWGDLDSLTLTHPVNNKQIFTNDNSRIKGYASAPLYNTSQLVWKSNTPTVRTDTTIKKSTLLKTEFSPCDLLLDYCKTFGLYFVKDKYNKEITIMSKNTFFNGNVVDLSKRIDNLKDMQIKPHLFATKYYLMKNEDNDSYFARKYHNDYNLTYGQKRIDTNYNFNKDTQEVYKDSIFQNAVSAVDTSPYYRAFRNKNNVISPCWVLENAKYTLYSDNLETYDKTLKYANYIDMSKTTNYNVKNGYDMFAKTCFYQLDNNQKSLCDINSTLLFFNGMQPTQDENGNEINYWLTDDLSQMITLNDGEMCWLYTETEFDVNTYRIAYKRNTLPQFTRYLTNANDVIDSLDFGVPKETYIPNLNYVEETTLYNKYWKNYLGDRYDVNTRKVTCYVNLEGMSVNQDFLRNFYYFNNCLWVCNKIDNYIYGSHDTTKVEFVKVNSTQNYVNGQFSYFEPLTLSDTETTVDGQVTTANVTVNSSTDWQVNSLLGEAIPSSGESGEYVVKLNFTPNFGTNTRKIEYEFTDPKDNKVTYTINQLPLPINAKHLSGTVYNRITNKPYEGYNLRIYHSNGELMSLPQYVKTDNNGFYQLMVNKPSIANMTHTYVELYGTDVNFNDINLYDKLITRKMILWENFEPREVINFPLPVNLMDEDYLSLTAEINEETITE